MLNEQKKVVYKFLNTYRDRKNANIVIYGTGINSQAVVEHCKEYNIIALMDAQKIGNRMWGIPIISERELLDYKTDFIVILARPAVYSIIYSRIADFVEKHNIPVFNVEGKNVKDLCKVEARESEYFNVSRSDLLREIDRNNVISFDVFDTLIMRKTLYPTDVFEIMAYELKSKIIFNFVSERISAEKELLKQMNPTIYAIYKYIGRKWDISSDLIDELIQLEIQIERRTLLARMEMLDIFRYCLRKKKSVYLITDMYLTSDILIHILEEIGISGYDDIYISCEQGCSKENGLFEKVKLEVGCDKWLHIGDNMKADIEAARKVGLNAFYIMSAINMLEISLHDRLLVHIESIHQRMVIGLYISKLFNNPFLLYQSAGKVNTSKAGNEGYIFIAPLLMGFVFWLANTLINKNIDKIIFGARDGYIIQKLYKIVCKALGIAEVDNQYLLISRRSISMAAIRNEQDILRMLDDYKGTQFDALSELYGIREQRKGDALVLDYTDDILVKANLERQQYLKYVLTDDIKGQKIVFFDFMSRGTCQLMLEKVLNTKLSGIYFQKSESSDIEKNNLDFESFCTANSAFEKNYNIFKFCDFLEMIVSDYNPSFWGISDSGTALFYEEKRSEEQMRWLEKIHKEIIEYCNDFLDIFPYETHIPFELCDEILGLMSGAYSYISEEHRRLQMYDGYNGRQVKVEELFNH